MKTNTPEEEFETLGKSVLLPFAGVAAILLGIFFIVMTLPAIVYYGIRAVVAGVKDQNL